MKKILMMAAAFAAVCTFAYETETINKQTWIYSDNGDEAVIVGITPQPTGTLTIPATLGGKPVSLEGSYEWQYQWTYGDRGWGEDWHYDYDSPRTWMMKVTKVVIPSTVMEIPDGAFQAEVQYGEWNPVTQSQPITRVGGWGVLAAVDLPDSIVRIGRSAFYGTPFMVGTKPNELACSADGRWLIGVKDFSGPYSSEQDYYDSMTVCIPASVQFIADAALANYCHDDASYGPQRTIFLGARPEEVTEDAFTWGWGEDEPRCVYFMEGASGWTDGELWCGVTTRSTGELADEWKVPSRMTLGTVCCGRYKYATYTVTGGKETTRELDSRSCVEQYTFKYPGLYKDGYCENYALIPVYGATSADEVDPVVEYGSAGSKRIGVAEVWTDQKVMSAYMPALSTKSKWNDDGDHYEYEIASAKNLTEYAWPKALWPNGKADSTRFWIAVDAKAMEFLNTELWAGDATFRVGMRGTSEWTDPIHVLYNRRGAYPAEMGEIFRGLDIRGAKDLEVNYEGWTPNGNTFYKMNIVSGTNPPKLTVALPEAGTLYFYTESEYDHDGASKENLTITGTGILADTQKGYEELYNVDQPVDEDWNSWYDRLMCEYAACQVLRSIKVGKATTLTLTGKKTTEIEMDVYRMQFFPASKKAVAVEATFGAFVSDAFYTWDRGYAQGYVKGMGVYTKGERVNLVAVPGPDEEFERWEVLCGEVPKGTDLEAKTLSFAVTDDISGTPEERKQIVVKAVWRQKHSVSALPVRAGSAKISGSGLYYAGDKVQLKVTPADGCTFVKWVDGCTDNPRTVEVGKGSVERVYYAVVDGDIGYPPVEAFADDVVARYDGKAHSGKVTVTSPATGATVRYRVGEFGSWTTTPPAFKEEGKYFVQYLVTAPKRADCEGEFMVKILSKYGWEIDENGILTSVAGDLFGKIRIPEEVDDIPVEGIGAWLFAGNTKITSVTVPSGVWLIGDRAFAGCTALTELHFEGEVPDVGDGIYADCSKVTTFAIADYGWEGVVDDDKWQGRPVKLMAELRIAAGEGGSVSASGGTYLAGTKLQLKATPASGCLFRGWWASEEELLSQQPTLSYVTGNRNEFLFAEFILATEDYASVGCEFDGELETGFEIDPIPVCLDCGSTPTVKATGLPAGLKFTNKDVFDSKKVLVAPANTIYGKPTKSGIYDTVVSVTTAGKKTADCHVKFVVRKPDEKIVDVSWDPEVGKVSGMGICATGRSLTLKATAAKGYVFAGWRDESGEIISQQPNFAYGVKSADVLLSAEFIPLEEDGLWISGAGDRRMNVNETCSFAFADLFGVESGSLPTITVKGLPAGLKYDAKAQTISGKATKTGIYWVTVSAKNAGGYAHSVTVKWTVGYPSATDYDHIGLGDTVDFLDDLATGVAIYRDLSYSDQNICSGGGNFLDLKSVAGLPTGLKFYPSKYYYDDLCWGGCTTAAEISGMPTKAGKYTVTFTDRSNRKAVKTVVVRDSGSAYLTVKLGAGGYKGTGTVSGGGVYAIGSKVKLGAKPDRNCYFAGWYADESLEMPCNEHIDDYLKSSASLDFSYLSWFDLYEEILPPPDHLYAKFVTKDEDSHPEIICDDEWLVASSDSWVCEVEGSTWFEIGVYSETLPKLTAKGVPAGIKFDGTFRELYVSDRTKLKPGVYSVTISLSNQSGAKAKDKVVTVRVPNLRDSIFNGLEYENAYVVNQYVSDACTESWCRFTVDSSWTVTASGLPSGLKFSFEKGWEGLCGGGNQSTGRIIGTPTKAGTYTVTFTAKRRDPWGGGTETRTATVTLTVNPLPAYAVGKFNGVLEDANDGSCIGTFALTASSAGKLSATLTLKNGLKKSYSASSWNCCVDGEYMGYFYKQNRSGCTEEEYVIFTVTPNADWNGCQLTGDFMVDACMIGGVGRVRAQRNAFGKVGITYENWEAHAIAETLKSFGEMPAYVLEDTEDDFAYSLCCPNCCDKPWNPQTLNFTVGTDGAVKVSGKVDGMSISASSALLIIGDQPQADFCLYLKQTPIWIHVDFYTDYGPNGAVIGTMKYFW